MSSFASPYVVLPFPDLVGIGDRFLMGESLLWLLRTTLHRCGAPFRVLSLLDRWLFLSWNPSPRAADRGFPCRPVAQRLQWLPTTALSD